MVKNKYVIYEIRNLITGWVYIGQTKHFKRRMIEHFGIHARKGTSYIHRSIQTYGKDNFSCSIIDEALSRDELNTKESKWISLRHCYVGDPLYKGGYNLTSGGDSFIMSDETKSKISSKAKGRTPWNKGTKKQKKPFLGFKGEHNPFYGKKHTTESKQKVSQANLGRVRSETFKNECSKRTVGAGNPSAVKVRCVETGKIYSCAKYACEEYSIDLSNLIKVCKGKLKTAGKLHWEYASKEKIA